MSLRSDPEKMKIYKREWARKRNQKNPNYQKNYMKKIRLRVIKKLGGKCVYCGCDIPEALEINHTDKNKKQVDKKKYGTVNTKAFLLRILNGKRSTDDLELTCRICNNWYYLVKDKGIPEHWIIKWEKN